MKDKAKQTRDRSKAAVSRHNQLKQLRNCMLGRCHTVLDESRFKHVKKQVPYGLYKKVLKSKSVVHTRLTDDILRKSYRSHTKKIKQKTNLPSSNSEIDCRVVVGSEEDPESTIANNDVATADNDRSSSPPCVDDVMVDEDVECDALMAVFDEAQPFRNEKEKN